MEELNIIRNRRKEEHRKGDVRRACEKCSLTPPAFQSALKKEQLDDLTETELRVVRAYIEILDERKKEKEHLKDMINGLR